MLVHSDIVNFLLKTNDGRGRRLNLLFMKIGMLTMFWLKLWTAKGESYQPAFVDNWPTIVLTFLALPHIVIGWVLLQRNENMGSVQDFIFLFLCML